MSLIPIPIIGLDAGGLQTNKKPVWIPDNAFQQLYNGYVFRDRTRKREGLQFLGRLQRVLTNQSLGNSSISPWTFNIFTLTSITESHAELNPGTLVITLGAITFTDQGNGTLTANVGGNSGTVNYITGSVTLTHTAGAGVATTANFNYFPSLPVMGIQQRELAGINSLQTIWFDTKYAYVFSSGNPGSFSEFIPGTTWAGTDSDFFWTTNYRGINPSDRFFFATNFVNDAADPIRYTDGVTWTNFVPALSADDTFITQQVGSIAGSGTTFTGTLPNAPINPGSVTITVAGITFTDPTGSGTLTGNPNTNSGTINYTTGAITLNFSPTINFTGPISNITKANPGQVTSTAHHLTTGAQITISGVTGMTQVNGQTYTITFVDANNFTIGIDTSTFGNYISGGDWTLTNQSMTVTATYQTIGTFLFQARLLIPYFGRLLALNVWEGSSISNATNIFNRCRFSQIGSPVASDAWRSDIFGKGGFIDAPTNEQIIGCTFLNNTLIVFFENTTWQLRYVGEYGLPFNWERIASDLGSDSTFSTVLFNDDIKAIGDKAIIRADSNRVVRLDLNIPDQIFQFQSANNGVKRVQGVRDYQRELVFWCYPDGQTQAANGVTTIYPNKVLVYNYRNNTWAIFRDNITAFGTLQAPSGITWDSQTVTWDDEDITWDDFDALQNFPYIVSGNQQGFCHQYGYVLPDQQSLSITGFSVSANVISLTINNHNLANSEIIYITNMLFVDSVTLQPVTTNLNNNLYQVSVTDINTVQISKWNFGDQAYELNFSFTPNPATSTYIGGGQAALMPRPAIQTKDFNPYQAKGLQTKLSYIDFLMDVPNSPPIGFITGATNAANCQITSLNHGLLPGQQIFISQVGGMTALNVGASYTVVTVIDANNFTINQNTTNTSIYAPYTSGGQWTLLLAGVSIQLFINTSPAISGNLLVGNKELKTFGSPPFYGPASDIAWNRFYSTCAGQYFNILLTYDENLMNTYAVHKQAFALHAVNIWTRPGGKIVF